MANILHTRYVTKQMLNSIARCIYVRGLSRGNMKVCRGQVWLKIGDKRKRALLNLCHTNHHHSLREDKRKENLKSTEMATSSVRLRKTVKIPCSVQ